MKKRAHKKLVKKILNNPVVKLKYFIEHDNEIITLTYKDYMELDKQTQAQFIKEHIDCFNITKYAYDSYDGYRYHILLNANDERRATVVVINPTLRDADDFIDSYEAESSEITNYVTHNRKRPSKITQKDIDEALDFINDIEKMKREINLDELE